MKHNFCKTCDRFVPDVEFDNGKKYNICRCVTRKELQDDFKSHFSFGHYSQQEIDEMYPNLERWVRRTCKSATVQNYMGNKWIFLDPIRKIPDNCKFKVERTILK